MTLRRALTIICLAAIVVLCVATRLLQLPFIDRRPASQAMAAYPDRQWPQYPRFLEGVRAGGEIAQVVLVRLVRIDHAHPARAADMVRQRVLEGVRAHTKKGDTITLVVPAMGWDAGYSYAYYRASYFLAGREVLPLVTPENGRIPQNLRAAKYIAAFGVGLRVPADVVWQGEHGALLRLRQ